MKQLESFFEISGKTDSKHINNTCCRPVPQGILDAIENGCSLESLENLVNQKFDVFKYNTQITIHGLFPDTTTKRIGGSYVNLIQNKNRSIGVRYNAIDREKKSRLFSLLHDVCGWSIEDNSTNFGIYQMKKLPNLYFGYSREQYTEYLQKCKEIVKEFKEKSEKIDTSLFTGNVSCYLAESMFGKFVVLSVNIRCFYEKDFERIFENLSGGMSVADAKIIQAEKRAEKARERAEREKQYEINRKQREEREKQETAKFLAENPLPEDFVMTENYIPEIGDIYAFLSVGWSGKPEWIIRKVKKHAGKLLSKPCNLDGEEKGKGNVISGKMPGKYYVKRIKAEKTEKYKLVITNISEKAFILTGETYPIRSKIKNLGGVWNKFRQGWIFANRHESAVRAAFSI